MAGTPHLSDLRREFYGGSTQSEHEALLAAKAQGISFLQLLEAANAVASDGGEQADLSGLISTHNTSPDAHDGVVRWGTAGMEDGLLFLQTATPANVKGIWFKPA